MSRRRNDVVTLEDIDACQSNVATLYFVTLEKRSVVTLEKRGSTVRSYVSGCEDLDRGAVAVAVTGSTVRDTKSSR